MIEKSNRKGHMSGVRQLEEARRKLFSRGMPARLGRDTGVDLCFVSSCESAEPLSTNTTNRNNKNEFSTSTFTDDISLEV